jgi:hypothetical protein
MRHFVVALCCMALSNMTAAALPVAEEEAVYRSYVAAFKAIKSFEDRSFEKYLSKTAQKRWADALTKRLKGNCDPCPSEEQELEMAKTMRPFPDAGLRPARSEVNGAVTLIFKWRQPGVSSAGTTVDEVSVVVELIKEGSAWKLKREFWVVAASPGSFNWSGQTAWSY